jgi:hypothetical protein
MPQQGHHGRAVPGCRHRSTGVYRGVFNYLVLHRILIGALRVHTSVRTPIRGAYDTPPRAVAGGSSRPVVAGPLTCGPLIHLKPLFLRADPGGVGLCVICDR